MGSMRVRSRTGPPRKRRAPAALSRVVMPKAISGETPSNRERGMPSEGIKPRRKGPLTPGSPGGIVSPEGKTRYF